MKYLVKLALFFILYGNYSCQNDDVPLTYEEGSNEYYNQWIYQQMKRYYLWSQDMPGQGDISQNPEEYFSLLLLPSDRFSYAFHMGQPETFPQNIRGIYGFDISFIEYNGAVYGAILYVLPDSPAYYNGLQRGGYITSINGTTLNTANYEQLYKTLSGAGQASLEIVGYEPDFGFTAPQHIILSGGASPFLPPVQHLVVEEGNYKVGYIQIPHFDIGLAQPLLQAFLDFKAQSVNKVVVDLRYNGGGDVSSATALSILLAPNIQSDNLFITFEGNQNGGRVDQTFEEALQMNEQQISFEMLRSAHPAIDEVYILCGSHTASASEIIINNLKPFMQVITIGERTVGKDVAGFPVKDDRIPGQQGWVLYPVIYKLFNSLHEGNYTTGIMPAIEYNELQDLQILPLGNPDEALFKKALNKISGIERAMYPKFKKLPLDNKNEGDNLIIMPAAL